jgi:hypothetical protein
MLGREPVGTDQSGTRLINAVGAELLEFARRALGAGPLADEAVAAALADGSWGRLELIARTAVECGRRSAQPDGPAGREPQASPAGANGSAAHPSAPAGPSTLAAAVAAELALATATLPSRQREVLALRGLLGLCFAEIGVVMSLEEPAVASLVARARLMLRSALRGGEIEPDPRCVDREHALRLLARRQDAEPVDETDTGWLFGHLRDCEGCARAHAAMLEAAVCYAAWGRP